MGNQKMVTTKQRFFTLSCNFPQNFNFREDKFLQEILDHLKTSANIFVVAQNLRTLKIEYVNLKTGFLILRCLRKTAEEVEQVLNNLGKSNSFEIKFRVVYKSGSLRKSKIKIISFQLSIPIK